MCSLIRNQTSVVKDEFYILQNYFTTPVLKIARLFLQGILFPDYLLTTAIGQVKNILLRDAINPYLRLIMSTFLDVFQLYFKEL